MRRQLSPNLIFKLNKVKQLTTEEAQQYEREMDEIRDTLRVQQLAALQATTPNPRPRPPSLPAYASIGWNYKATGTG